MTGVQHSQEQQIRAAMERLLTGQAIHARDRLDVVGLAAEAGVTRQDLYRHYGALLEEFRDHRRRLEVSVGATDKRAARLEELRAQLAQANERAARYRAERDAARGERDANASQVAYLEAQNQVLRDQLETQARAAALPGRAHRQSAGTRF